MTYENVLLRHLSTGLRNERRTAIEALEKNNPDTPLVTPSIVLLPFDDLRCHILASADNTHSRSAVTASITPAQERLAVVCILLLVLVDSRHDTACPLHRSLQTATFRLVLVIALEMDAQLVEQAVPVTVEVCGVVRPVTVKCQTEVADLQMTRGRDEKIVRLDISMNDLERMGRLDT